MKTSALKYSPSELDRMGFKMEDTIEMLQIEPWFHHTAIIPYRDYVILGVWHGIREDKDFSFALYRFKGKEHTIESPLTLIHLEYYAFSDLGEAVKAALARADELMKGRC